MVIAGTANDRQQMIIPAAVNRLLRPNTSATKKAEKYIARPRRIIQKYPEGKVGRKIRPNAA